MQTTATDEALMSTFQQTLDEAVFEELMTRYHQKAYLFAKGLLFEETMIEDAVQEAFIRVVKKSHLYNSSKPFRPWFYQVLRNTCFDLYRKNKRHFQKLNDYSDALHCQKRTATSRGMSIYELLAPLSPKDREILLLRFVEEWTLKKISLLIGCSEDAAKKRSQRALKKLKNCFTNEQGNKNFEVKEVKEIKRMSPFNSSKT